VTAHYRCVFHVRLCGPATTQNSLSATEPFGTSYMLTRSSRNYQLRPTTALQWTSRVDAVYRRLRSCQLILETQGCH
jgi:hypothetical protein